MRLKAAGLPRIPSPDTRLCRKPPGRPSLFELSHKRIFCAFDLDALLRIIKSVMRLNKSAFGIGRSRLVLLAIGLWVACLANAQTVTFNFDTGSPALQAGQNIPFDQTVGGVTAHFSSPNGSAFSVQSDSTLGWTMSQFSGSYLYDNDLNMNPLDIKFSYPITRITLTFATADFHQSEVPSNILLTAYVDSTATAAVGSATAHGTYGSDVYPMGTITFDSGGVPFNLVELKIPVQPLGVTDYFVDNITVTPVLLPSCTLALNSPGAALTADGTSTSGFYPTGHLTFTVTPSAGCAGVTWTATIIVPRKYPLSGYSLGEGNIV